MCVPIVYIAASFRHRHAVRLLGLKLREFGYEILDWTDKATPPQGLSVAQRREWMDTDVEEGEVFSFCKNSCLQADFLVYFGESGQDAGVEVGIAYGGGVPLLGIRGTLEAPGLMLYGAVDVWVEDIEEALSLLKKIAIVAKRDCKLDEKNCKLDEGDDPIVKVLCTRLNSRKLKLVNSTSL